MLAVKRPPKFGWGFQKSPPISQDRIPQGVAPSAGIVKAQMAHGIKGITWSISGKKTNIDFTSSISF